MPKKNKRNLYIAEISMKDARTLIVDMPVQNWPVTSKFTVYAELQETRTRDGPYFSFTNIADFCPIIAKTPHRQCVLSKLESSLDVQRVIREMLETKDFYDPKKKNSRKIEFRYENGICSGLNIGVKIGGCPSNAPHNKKGYGCVV